MAAYHYLHRYLLIPCEKAFRGITSRVTKPRDLVVPQMQTLDEGNSRLTGGGEGACPYLRAGLSFLSPQGIQRLRSGYFGGEHVAVPAILWLQCG
jgi:hypothetical protein